MHSSLAWITCFSVYLGHSHDLLTSGDAVNLFRSLVHSLVRGTSSVSIAPRANDRALKMQKAVGSLPSALSLQKHPSISTRTLVSTSLHSSHSDHFFLVPKCVIFLAALHTRTQGAERRKWAGRTHSIAANLPLSHHTLGLLSMFPFPPFNNSDILIPFLFFPCCSPKNHPLVISLLLHQGSFSRPSLLSDSPGNSLL